MNKTIDPPAGKEDRPVTVAIIGVSGYAEVVLEALLSSLVKEKTRLVAATLAGDDARSETAARLAALGTRLFSDYRAMLDTLAGDLTLCVIPTGIHWHTRMSVHALQIGAHVLVEKPLAGSVGDASTIADTARSTGKFVAVGFQDMYSAATHSIKRWLWEKNLGPIRTIEATGSWPRTGWYYTRNDWAGKISADGWAVRDSPLNNAFAHFLNLALYFAGDPRDGFAAAESCRGRLVRHFPIEAFDTSRVEWQTRNGVTVRCAFTHFDPVASEPRITVECARGCLVWEFEREAVARGADGKTIRRWMLDKAPGLRRAMIEHVLSCARNGRTPLCTADDALAHVRAVEMAFHTLPIEDAGIALSAGPPS